MVLEDGSRRSQFKNNKKNADEMRKKRAEKLHEDRKMRRADAALLRRNVTEIPVTSHKIDQKVKLEKWKSEKREKERLLKLSARPPFVTGTVKHKVGSPHLYQVEAPVADRRITRATVAKKTHNVGIEKRIVSKDFKFKAPAGIVPIPISYPPAMGKLVTNKKIQIEKSVKKVTNKDGKTKSECKNYSEDKIDIEVKPSESTKEPPLETIIKATVASLSIKDDVGRDVTSFRKDLDTEIANLQLLCEQWTELKDVTNLPDHVNDMIDLTVGQTKLLISQKLAQYRGLINECEAGSDKVTCSDLQGFWDMVYMQVKDVNFKFHKLQCLKDNNWIEVDMKEKPVVVKKINIPKRQIYNAKSSIRGFIAAARNKSTKTASTRPERQNTPQDRKSEGVKALFTPKSHSEKENKFKPKTPVEMRRVSQVLMKVSNQAKEIGTPKSQKKNNIPVVEAEDIEKPRSVKFSGKAVQFDGDSPSVSKVKCATPFVRHKLNDMDETRENIQTSENINTQDTPKRACSLRRSTRLNK